MCLFCQIVQGQQKADLVYQDEQVVAFKDIHPLAPVHILIIPIKHISAITEVKESDIELLGRMIFAAKKIADDLGLTEKGYKLLFRVKEYGGQVIDHIHLHLIGGAPLYEDIHPLDRPAEKSITRGEDERENDPKDVFPSQKPKTMARGLQGGGEMSDQ